MTNDRSEPNENPDRYEIVGDRVAFSSVANLVCELSARRPPVSPVAPYAQQERAHGRAIRLEAELLNGQRPSAGNIPTLASVIDKYTQFLTSEGRAKDARQVRQHLSPAEGTGQPAARH